MISIDIHRQRVTKNWRKSCRFFLFPWGNQRELTVFMQLYIKHFTSIDNQYKRFIIVKKILSFFIEPGTFPILRSLVSYIGKKKR